MSLLLNRAKAVTATTGTGTVTLGTGVVPYRSWAAAGASGTTRRYSYLIEDGNDWEVGEGVFNSGAGTLTRNLIASSTGSLLILTGSATVACVAKATDGPQLIEKKVFAGGETSFTFSDIPQDFTSLELEIFGRLQVAAAVQLLAVTFNANGGAVYDYQRKYGLSTTLTGSQGLAGTSLPQIIALPGTSHIAGNAGHSVMKILGYSQTSFHKQIQGLSRWPNSTSTGDGYTLDYTGSFRSTVAITSIEILTIPASGQMVANSYAVLRGIP